MEDDKEKPKYLNFNGRMHRTPFGYALTIFVNDKLLEFVAKRDKNGSEDH